MADDAQPDPYADPLSFARWCGVEVAPWQAKAIVELVKMPVVLKVRPYFPLTKDELDELALLQGLRHGRS